MDPRPARRFIRVDLPDGRWLDLRTMQPGDAFDALHEIAQMSDDEMPAAR